MADKEKKLRKILLKYGLKGKLKPVKTLEEAFIVFVGDPRNPKNNQLFHKRVYQMALDRGDTFPEDLVYFLIPTNSWNIRQVIESILKSRLVNVVP